MKKIISLVLCLTMLAFCFAGCAATPAATTEAPKAEESVAAAEPATEAAEPAAVEAETLPGEGKTIACLHLTYGYAFFTEMLKGQKEVLEAAGYTVEDISVEQDIAKEISAIEDFINKGVAGFLVNPVDGGAEGLQLAVQAAMEAGIPVVTNDCTMGCDVDGFITSDNYQAGYLMGKYVIDRLGGTGKVGIIDYFGEPIAQLRVQGFRDAIATSSIEIVDDRNCSADTELAMQITEDMLTAHPDIQAFFSFNDNGAYGGFQTIYAMNKQNDCFVVSVDGSNLAYDSIVSTQEDGSYCWGASAAQVPVYMGQQAALILRGLIEGTEVEKEVTLIPSVMSAETLDQFTRWED